MIPESKTLKRSLEASLPCALTRVTASPESTFELGREIAARVPENGTVFLFGELGAGKTLLTKGLCSGLGIDPAEVTSPSFVIMTQYQGDRLVFHIDLYRIEEAEELDELGLEELFSGPGVKIVEWAEKLDCSRFRCDVAGFLEVGPDDTRTVEIRSA